MELPPEKEWLDDDPEAEIEQEKYYQSQKLNGSDDEVANSRPRFELIDASQLRLNKQSVYRVKNMIPAQGLVVVWGPPKCGKSFWVLDLLFHIALGWEYRGHRVKQGLVVYIGCEGEFAVPARVEAFRQEKIKGPIDPERFKLVLTRLDLVVDIEELVNALRVQLTGNNPAVITIDTLNRSLKGSESSDEDMSNYVKACDRLREEFGCVVVLIHHCGIVDTRPRGHTSLTGAADAQIAVKKDNKGLITTLVEWLKDGPEGEATASRFKIITGLDIDEDGEPISSCVLEKVEHVPQERHPQPAKLSGNAKIALEALRKAIDKTGEPAPAGNDVPSTARVVQVETWRKYYYAMVPLDDGDLQKAQNTRKKAFQRAREALQQTAPPTVAVWKDLAWIVSK